MRAPILLFYFLVHLKFIYGLHNYLGCFIKHIDNPDLETFIGAYNQLTPVQCILTCKKQNYNYAAIQSGNQCYCTEEYTKYDKVSDDECDYLCLTSDKCGGYNRTSVYSVVNSIDSLTSDSKCLNSLGGYEGCFDGLAINNFIGIANSIDQCIAQCDTSYGYAGIINGNLCYCGINLPQSSVNSIACNIACKTSSIDTLPDCCGGHDTMSVYHIKIYQSTAMEALANRHIRVKRDANSLATDTTNTHTTQSAMPTVSSFSAAGISFTSNSITSPYTPTIASGSSTSSITSQLPNLSSLSISTQTGTPIQTSVTNGPSSATLSSVQPTNTNQMFSSAPTQSAQSTSSSSSMTSATPNQSSSSFTGSYASTRITTTPSINAASSSANAVTVTSQSSMTVSASQVTQQTSMPTIQTNPTIQSTMATSSTTASIHTTPQMSYAFTTSNMGISTGSASTSQSAASTQSVVSTITQQPQSSTSISTTGFVTSHGSATTATQGITSIATQNTVITSNQGITSSMPQTGAPSTPQATATSFTQAAVSTISQGTQPSFTSASVSTASAGIGSSVTQASVSTVSSGTASSVTQPSVSTVTGGTASSVTQASVSTVSGRTASSVTQAGVSSASQGTSVSTVSGGTVSSVTQASVSTVSGGTASSVSQPSVSTVSGGMTSSVTQASVSTVSGGTASSVTQPSVSTVSGGTASSVTQASVSTVSGGTVSSVAHASVSSGTVSSVTQGSVSTVSGGTVSSVSQASVSTVSGGTASSVTQASVSSVSQGTSVSTASAATGSSVTQASVSTVSQGTGSSEVTSQASITSNAGTSATNAATTTVSASNLVYTEFIVYFNSFDPNNAANRSALQQGLIAVINLGYTCLSNPSYALCTAPSRRRRATSGVDVQIQNIILISNSTTGTQIYRVYYTATNPNGTISAAALQTVVGTVPRSQQILLLGFPINGALVQSSSITTVAPITSTDNQLWIIGAVLGPIAFVLLLIGICCCLHMYFRRKQSRSVSTAEAVYHAPQMLSRGANYQAIRNDIIRERMQPLDSSRGFGQPDTTRNNTMSSKRLPPLQTHKTMNNVSQYPASADIPLQDMRRQHEVEHWRNKVRLQEKFEQHYADPLNDLDQLQNSSLPRAVSPFSKRSTNYQYDNRNVELDLTHGTLRSINELNMFEPQVSSIHGTRHAIKTPEVQTGRTKMHRLLDEVLDQAEPNQSNNVNSQIDIGQRRLQQPQIHSTSRDPRDSYNEQIHHTPMMTRVSEHPDPILLRHQYNPYEAGDRIHDIEHALPVYSIDDGDYRKYNSQSPYRSSPSLFYDNGTQRRDGRTRIEPGRDFIMRPNADRAGHRQHKFDDDFVYIDTIPRNRDGTGTLAANTWIERDDNNGQFFHLNPSDLSKRNDYHDQYELARRSVVNTKSLVSAIHDDLQQIVSDPLNESHYV